MIWEATDQMNLRWLVDWSEASRHPTRAVVTAAALGGLGVGGIVYIDSRGWRGALVAAGLGALALAAVAAGRLNLGLSPWRRLLAGLFPVACFAIATVAAIAVVGAAAWASSWIPILFAIAGFGAIAVRHRSRSRKLSGDS